MTHHDWHCLHSADMSVAQLTPDNRGWAYGDGFFTTMAVMDGHILWVEHHQKRLITHASALQLSVPIDSIMRQLQAAANTLGEGVMKLVITRAPQAMRGYGFSHDHNGHACSIWLKATVMPLSTQALTLPNGHQVLMQPAITAVCLNAQIACLPKPLAGLKSLNRLDNVLASGELQAIKDNDAAYLTSEGLVRDMSGDWVEGTMSNVFYQLSVVTTHQKQTAKNDKSTAISINHGQWFTPPMTRSGVAGVMRGVITAALAGTDHPVIERSLTDDDLPTISAMFFCNAVRGVVPVTSLGLLSGDVISFKSI